MIAIVLLMFAAGIGIALSASDPKQVTLRWLRLGAIIAICFVAIASALSWKTQFNTGTTAWRLQITLLVPFFLQLIAIQLGCRHIQRLIGVLAVLATLFFLVELYNISSASPPVVVETLQLAVALTFSSALLGGFLMAMLLGHAYLTAGSEMTQKPFMRLVVLLGMFLLLRGIFSLTFALLPFVSTEDLSNGDRLMNTVLLWARYLVGIATPSVFVYMTYDCVKRRANQSATGILYVATVLIILGEGAAFVLMRATSLPF